MKKEHTQQADCRPQVEQKRSKQ